MEYLLSFVEENLYLFIALIVVLFIILIILIIIINNKRKRNNIKKEFEEVTKIEEENEETKKEVKPEVAFELEKILEKMEKDIQTKPEEVVRKFEEEQEQKAIISYQELLNNVNNNNIETISDEEGDIDFVAALEEELESKQDSKPEKIENKESVVTKSHLDVIDVMDSEEETKKFQGSEILSPVFGRMQPDFEYQTIDSFSLSNNKVELEQVAGLTPADELAANEDFLKALIEFRNSLE